MRGRSFVPLAIIAVPFFAAIGLAIRLDEGPVRPPADVAHPGFVLRDETAAAGIHFVHRRPSFDRKILNIEPHVAAVGASVSVADVMATGGQTCTSRTAALGSRTRSIATAKTARSRTLPRVRGWRT